MRFEKICTAKKSKWRDSPLNKGKYLQKINCYNLHKIVLFLINAKAL